MRYLCTEFMRKHGLKFYVLAMALFISALLVMYGFSQQKLPENTNFEPSVYAVAEALYEYDLPKADSLLTVYKTKFPNHPWGNLLKANYLWWVILSGEKSPEVVMLFENNLNAAIKTINLKKSKGFYRIFFYKK